MTSNLGLESFKVIHFGGNQKPAYDIIIETVEDRAKVTINSLNSLIII